MNNCMKDKTLPYFLTISLTMSGVDRENSLGISNVNMSAMRYVLGYYTLYRLLTFRSKLDINLLFVFDYNINHYNTLKMKKELCLFSYLFLLL